MFSYRGFSNTVETKYLYSVCITRTNKLKVIKFSFTQCINRNLRYSMCCLLVIKKLLKQQSIHTTRTFNLFQQHLKCCLPVKFVLCNFCMIKGDGSFVHQRAEKTLVQLHFDRVRLNQASIVKTISEYGGFLHIFCHFDKQFWFHR